MDEALSIWNSIIQTDRDEIAYHAYMNHVLARIESDNIEAVRRGTVGAGVLPESASAAAKARIDLHESIDRAIAKAKAERDKVPENEQSGGGRNDLQTTANTPE